MAELLSDLIAERVEVALSNRFRCELLDPKTGKPMSADDRRKTLTVLFGEIAKGMGIDRFVETPIERLDQFAVMSVVKNHDTAGLLRSLVNSFMIAYGTPETSDQAFQALLKIEALRAQVADSRGQLSNNQRLLDAAHDLNSHLTKVVPGHSVVHPRFRILVGADRLFVMSPKAIKDLPAEIDGVPVESMIDDLRVMAQ